MQLTVNVFDPGEKGLNRLCVQIGDWTARVGKKMLSDQRLAEAHVSDIPSTVDVSNLRDVHRIFRRLDAIFRDKTKGFRDLSFKKIPDATAGGNETRKHG